MKTRYVAHVTIEAQTPLKVGSNASDFLQDSPIQKDWNGLPMILGTSLAGVLRKDFNNSKVKDIFGEENGSKVIISNALLCINNQNEVCESLLFKKTSFLKLFDNLPLREHTVITAKGVSDNKFDEEVLYKGSRLKFSIELIESDESTFNSILELLSNASFRIGGGATKGFGKINIVEIKTDSFNMQSYEDYSSSLNHKLKNNYELKYTDSKNHTKYILNITPEDFFIFGSGFGDSDADATPVYEKVVDYKNATLSDEQILIPASSIKGALAHRTTFHFNKINNFYIGNSEAKDSIKEIFGEAKNSKDDVRGSRGKVIFSDCYQVNRDETKIFDHVSIDRFTGGAMDGALFNEKTIAQKDAYTIEILLDVDIKGDELLAFEKALTDITRGMLPLGGMTTKGHGIFVGKVFKNGKELCKTE